MYDILIQISGLLSQSIYTRADQAIAEMCALAWAWLMAPLVGLVLAYHVILITMDNNKGWGALGKDMLKPLLPLLIAAWIIRPDAGGCAAVDIKKEALDARAVVTEILAPGFGANPDALLLESVKSVAGIMGEFVNTVSNASKATTTNSVGDSFKAIVSAVSLSTNYIILGLTGLFVMILAAVMSAVVMAHILIQDFSLVLGAIFFPVGVALWPVSKTWAMSALSVMLQAVFASAAFAFFIDVLFAKNGALDHGVQAAISMFPTQTSPIDQSVVVIGASLAVLAFLISTIAVAYAIPRILKQIFVKLEFQIVGNP